jgi:halocyanin-like protein
MRPDVSVPGDNSEPRAPTPTRVSATRFDSLYEAIEVVVETRHRVGSTRGAQRVVSSPSTSRPWLRNPNLFGVTHGDLPAVRPREEMFDSNQNATRRRVLEATATTLLGVSLAGCSSGGGSGDGGSSDGSGSGGSADGSSDGSSGESGSGGSADGSSGGSDPDFDGWFEGVSNFDGVVDETGSNEVTVTVGSEANGGNFGFDPAAVRVDAGTTVVWEWNGEGGSHNVAAEDGSFESELVAEEGHTFSHDFEEAGTVKYACTPHETVGMRGAVVVV